MKGPAKRLIGAPAITALVLAGVAACSGAGNGPPAATTTPASSEAAPVQRWSEQMVEVNGHRVWVACKGEGEPAVMLVSTLAEDGMATWGGSEVPDAVARRTKVCIYDRPGLGHSDPVTSERTIENHTAELEKIVGAAKIKTPIIVVGQGYGTFVARLFAKNHLDKTAGMVLVDPTLWITDPNPPDGSTDGQKAEYAALGKINVDLGGYGGAALPPPPLPVVILGVDWEKAVRPGARPPTRGTAPGTAPSGTTPATPAASPLDPPAEKRREMQRGLANKSPYGKFIDLPESGSAVQFWKPQAVTDAIFLVLDSPNLKRS